ncbi:MAG: REP-associated tyrosine transposase [Terriglobia bacterium]
MKRHGGEKSVPDTLAPHPCADTLAPDLSPQMNRGGARKEEHTASSADRRFCGPRLFRSYYRHRAVPYSIAVSKLRRPLLSDRYLFIVVRLLRRREKFTEADFALLARAFNRARALHPYYLTAWVFLPDPAAAGHCIYAPVYPVTISLAMKSVKQSSTSAVNQHRGADGELWQPRFFDRALRTVKVYNEKVEYIHLNPVRAGLVSRPEDWSRPAGSSYNEYSGMSADESVSRRTV